MLYSQKEDLSQYKERVPFIIKSLQKLQLDRGNINESYDKEVAEVFKKPWEMKRIEDELSQEMMAVILKNKKTYVEEDESYEGKWNVVFSSFIGGATGEKIKDIFFRYDPVPNVFVTLSNIKLFDENNTLITTVEETKTKINKLTGVVFFEGFIPVTYKSKNVTGSFDVLLKEFKNIDYKLIKKGSHNIGFSLGGIDGFKLIKMEKNKVYIHLPKYFKNLKVEGTNKKGGTFWSQSKEIYPKKIVDYAMGENVNEKSTKLLIDSITEEDLISGPQILIYKTSGIIENFYIYTKSNPILLNLKRIKVKL